MSGLGGGGGSSKQKPVKGGMSYRDKGGATFTSKYDRDRNAAERSVIDEFNNSMRDYNSQMESYNSDEDTQGSEPVKPVHLTDKEIDAKVRGRVAQSPLLEQSESTPDVRLREKRRSANRSSGRKSTILSNNGGAA